MDGNNEEALQFEWTSPLAGAPSAFSRVKGAVAEQAMVCLLLLMGILLHKEEVLIVYVHLRILLALVRTFIQRCAGLCDICSRTREASM